jgi:hypothetical protein
LTSLNVVNFELAAPIVRRLGPKLPTHLASHFLVEYISVFFSHTHISLSGNSLPLLLDNGGPD